MKEIYEKIDNEYKVKYYQCENCNTLYTDKHRASDCCTSVICSICGREISRDRNKSCRESVYGTEEKPICRECHVKNYENNFEKVFEDEYIKNSNYGPILYGDEYYGEIDECLDDIFEDYTFEEAKDLCFQICEVKPCKKLDIGFALENLCESQDIDPDYFDGIYKDVDELYKFVDEWNKKQTGTYWEPVKKRLILNEETLHKWFDKESVNS